MSGSRSFNRSAHSAGPCMLGCCGLFLGKVEWRMRCGWKRLMDVVDCFRKEEWRRHCGWERSKELSHVITDRFMHGHLVYAVNLLMFVQLLLMKDLLAWCLLAIVVESFARAASTILVFACNSCCMPESYTFYSFHAGMYLVYGCVLLVTCTKPCLQRLDINCALECSNLSECSKTAGVYRLVVSL